MKFLTAALCALALACAACSDPAVPAAPSVAPALITDTFTATLNISGNNSHPVLVTQAGRFAVTLTSVDPAAAVGIGVGTASGGACVLLSANSPVVAGGTVVSGTALSGNLCVAVFDVGNLVEPVSYTISVSHS